MAGFLQSGRFTAIGKQRPDDDNSFRIRQTKNIRLRKCFGNRFQVVVHLGVRIDVENNISAVGQSALNLFIEFDRSQLQRNTGFVRVCGRLQKRVHVNRVVLDLSLREVIKPVGHHQLHIFLWFQSKVSLGQLHDDRVNFHGIHSHVWIILAQKMNHRSAAKAHDQNLALFRLQQVIGKHVLQVTEPQHVRRLQVHLTFKSFFAIVTDKDQRSRRSRSTNANVRKRGLHFMFNNPCVTIGRLNTDNCLSQKTNRHRKNDDC